MIFKLSQDAISDLDSISDYGIATWGSVRSQSYILDIFGLMELIATQPEMGEVYDSSPANAQMRFITHKSHMIFYKALETEIFILRVLGKEQLPKGRR